MKLSSMFLCFIALVMLTIPASALTESSFVFSGSITTDQSYNRETVPISSADRWAAFVYFNDIETLKDIDQITLTGPIAGFSGGSQSEWEEVDFYIGATSVGSGYLGYAKNAELTEVTLMVLFTNFDASSYSGAQIVKFVESGTGVGGTPSIKVRFGSTHYKARGSVSSASQYAYLGYYGSTWSGDSQLVAVQTNPTDISVYTQYSYSILYNYTSLGSAYLFNVGRSSTHPAQIILYTGGELAVNETTTYTTPFQYIESNSTKNIFTGTVTNEYSDSRPISISFVTITDSTGYISLNQSSYTEPELIQIDAGLLTYDFSGHAYTTYLQWRDDVGNWNTVSYVEYNESIGFFTDDPTKSIIGDIDFYKYEIPLRLRAVLIDFNKNTYISTTIAESNTVLYNPPAGALYLVTGTVVNADTDAVVTGATVSVTGPMSQSDTTNVNGRFYLYLADGTYTFNTTKSGYEDNIDTGIVINSDTSGIEIPLVPVSTDEGVIYGTITDSDTKDPLNDVHVIFTNATDTIHAYSASNGYYEAEGFDNDSVYAVRALKTGYYSYNGSITTETSGATHKSFDMVQTNYSATPIPTSVSTYPGGEGYEWTNDDIVTMLRILVPGIFLMMLIFLLLAVMMGFMPNNGGNQGGNSGLGELWRRK